ncbi:hypothetical protein C8A05DRAFT_17344, partial [Staphylotrichum tortipilum]
MTATTDPDTATENTMASPAPSSSLASPSPQSSSSPLPFVALAEQTFTPLSHPSFDTSDFYTSDSAAAGGGGGGGGGSQKPSPALEGDRLLSASRSMEHLRRNGNLSRSSSNSTAPGGSGLTIVSAMVESFEALQAATTSSTLGYELLRSKSAGHRPEGLVSPPSTLSPSPAPSFSRPPSPTPGGGTVPGLDAPERPPEDAPGLGAAGQTTRDEESEPTAPLAAAAPPSTSGASAAAATAVPPQAVLPSLSSVPASPPQPTATSTTAVVADTTVIRPTPSTRAAAAQPEQRSRAASNPIRPPILRTSSSASLSLSHPVPDLNKLSQAGNFLGNIAALEATAERLSMTSSIEDAIREEHNELKRTESRRSSILRARAASAASDTGSVYGQSQLSVTSRQNSILGINTAARLGGYSPGGFVMSPHHSMSAASGRLRSGSKASSIGMPSHILENPDLAAALADAEHAQEFRFLPRHGPGKASTRSVASKISLAQIAELEQPTALNQEAFDAADRAAAAGESTDDEVIRSTALQFIEAEFAEGPGAVPASPRLQLHQPVEQQAYAPYPGEDDRPTTSASAATFEQAQAAFGDFDGVHCDPDAGDFPSHLEPELHDLPPAPRAHAAPAPRPTTYIDPATGQQMLFYPAPVPAMLNLPPKLSKRPKPAAQAAHRSQIMSAMMTKAPRESRESRLWLPDPTEGNDGAPFLPDFLGESSASAGPNGQLAPAAGIKGETTARPPHARQSSEASTIHPPPEQREMRRPQRLTDAANRKSRPINAEGLPPQLRASVFFDLPSELPKIEVRDGSAMTTLDSLLNASAAAPVNAFTDHVFAGSLGAEVYGAEKKRKKKVKKAAPATSPAAAAAVPDDKPKRKTLVKRNSNGNLLEQPAADAKPKRKTLVKRNSGANLLDPNAEKKRASRFSFFGPKHVESDSDDDDRPRTGRDDDTRSHGSTSSADQLDPDEDEETEEETDDDEEQVYHGAPTTLLAELQLRKQQAKLRTRPVHHAHPDGMRSTLLELDTVAEIERRARHGKRVTLAWEDPAAVPHDDKEEDDEVPLGMLYAAKATGNGNGNRSTMDISALMSEMHRPLGLMERREMEENEPLSRRRDRLQGKVAEQLPTSLTELQKRVSHMPGLSGPAGMGTRSHSRLALPLPGGSRAGSMIGSRPGSAAGGGSPNNNGEDSDADVPGETLAARKARLAAENPLPRARPVSGAFTSELLREFGPDEEEPKPPAEEDAPVPEEEESLGQRRRRLQREREAREREMAFSSLTRAATPLGMPAAAAASSSGANTVRPVGHPMSLADVLGAHPAGGLGMDPRERERLRREAEAARTARENEVKMAALRAQMPGNLTAPSVVSRQGGFMAGRYNDGMGGGVGMAQGGLIQQQQQMMAQQQRVYQQQMVAQQGQQHRASTLLGRQGMGVGMGVYGGSTPNL